MSVLSACGDTPRPAEAPNTTNAADCSIDTSQLVIVDSPASLLSGKRAQVLPCDRHLHNGYEERFFADGRWEFDERGGALIIRRGRWRADNAQITIDADTYGAVSRPLYRNGDGVYFIDSILAWHLDRTRKRIPVSISIVQ